MQETKQCPFCKEDIYVKTIVCPHCDSDLSLESQQINNQWEPPREQYPPQQPSPEVIQMPPDINEGVKVLLFIVGILFPIVGIIAGAIFMGNANPRNHDFGRNLLVTTIVVAAISCVCIFAGLMEGLANLGI